MLLSAMICLLIRPGTVHDSSELAIKKEAHEIERYHADQ
jgi:hypothetical protein